MSSELFLLQLLLLQLSANKLGVFNTLFESTHHLASQKFKYDHYQLRSVSTFVQIIDNFACYFTGLKAFKHRPGCKSEPCKKELKEFFRMLDLSEIETDMVEETSTIGYEHNRIIERLLCFNGTFSILPANFLYPLTLLSTPSQIDQTCYAECTPAYNLTQSFLIVCGNGEAYILINTNRSSIGSMRILYR